MIGSTERDGGDYVAPVQSAPLRDANRYAVERRVRLRVDVIPQSLVLGDTIVPSGVHTVDVPKSQVEHVQALVRDPKDWALAERMYQASRDRWIAENAVGEGREDNAQYCPESPEKSYWAHFGSDPGALRSVDVVELDRPPTGDGRQRDSLSSVADFILAMREAGYEITPPKTAKRGARKSDGSDQSGA